MKKVLTLILTVLIIFACAACDPDTGGYTGPWWTQLGGNDEHTGTIDTADFGMPQKTAWIYEFKNGVFSMSAPVVVNGYVYFGATDGYVYCIRDKNKKLVWKYKTDYSITNTLIYKDDIIYAASNDGYVYALNAKNGKLIWFQFVDSAVNYSPVIAGNMLIVGTENGSVRGLSLDGGTEQWRYVLSSAVMSDITYYNYGVEGGIVYFGCGDGYVYALNASNGKFIWQFYTTVGNIETPAAYNGKVIFGTAHGTVHALDALTGEEIWNHSGEQGLYVGGACAVKDGKVLYGSYDYNLYCLNAETGEEIWTYESTYWITSAPTVVGNSVLFGTLVTNNTYYVFCVDFDTGDFRWKSQCTYYVRVAPTVVNGCVYYTNEGGKIIKLA